MAYPDIPDVVDDEESTGRMGLVAYYTPLGTLLLDVLEVGRPSSDWARAYNSVQAEHERRVEAQDRRVSPRVRMILWILLQYVMVTR